MKKITTSIFLISISLLLTGCGTINLQQAVAIAQQTGLLNGTLSSALDIGNGLKQALEFGVDKGVTDLGKKGGFLNNELVRVMLPKELQGVDKALRTIGLGSLSDKGLTLLNSAAEDAVKDAGPIFVSAIKGMNITDAKNILMGNEHAATDYLRSSTQNQLMEKFKPTVSNSLGKVGANDAWGNIMSKYNALPFVTKINPDLNSYVTEQAINGLFKMVANKELDIRTNKLSRTTDLLKGVFAQQDK